MVNGVGKEQLRVLLVGNGGREHAIAWKLSQEDHVEAVFVAPGNGGTANGLRNVKNVDNVSADEFPGLVSFARENKVNLVIPGPEAPLVAGIERFFRAAGIRVFGPSQQAAQLEGSKAFSKDFMSRHKIPTARYQHFSDYDKAKNFLENASYSVVLKASGLAAGKGVIIPSTDDEAHAALKSIMVSKEFGPAGDEVVIEEYLEGEEISVLSFSDGYTIRSLPCSQDYKKIYDGDRGPNTGGMGCYGPAPIATPQLIEEIHRTILQPTIDGMRQERMPFVGMLFSGIIITKDGPKTLEYNVRFGDPETQTILPLLDTDLSEIMVACTDGWLDNITIQSKLQSSATVMVAAGGYPGPYIRGDIISIDKDSFPDSNCVIFHSGTKRSTEGLITSGGRVLAANSIATSLEDAVSQAYKAISCVRFSGIYHRTDIGKRALSLRKAQSATNMGMTYESAGVSITTGNSFIKRISPLVASTARPGASAELGGFAGIFDLVAAGYTEPPNLIVGTDGVGTKLLLAHDAGVHDTIGLDLVAMCVNDLVVQGAKPLLFLDTYSCGRLDMDVAVQVVKGICAGCKESGCALVGGETAEMPGTFLNEKAYDVVGATVGAISRQKTILPDKESMRPGDIMLGLKSSGCHSNGFSLIRRIIEKAGLTVQDKSPWGNGETVGTSLLTPTRIYVKSILEAVDQELIKGMAHITGGGLLENVPRMLPKHLAAELDATTWEVPAVFKWLKSYGTINNEDFATVFNTGLGIVMAVEGTKVEKTTKILEACGETVYRVGKIVDREGGDGCTIRNMDGWA